MRGMTLVPFFVPSIEVLEMGIVVYVGDRSVLVILS